MNTQAKYLFLNLQGGSSTAQHFQDLTVVPDIDFETYTAH